MHFRDKNLTVLGHLLGVGKSDQSICLGQYNLDKIYIFRYLEKNVFQGIEKTQK